MRYWVSFCIALFFSAFCNADDDDEAATAWKNDWLVEQGFALDSIAVDGLEMPTALAIVDSGSDDPSAPWLFITELRGKVKVLARDGSLHDFFDLATIDRNYIPIKELPGGQGQGGLAGLCLDPKSGYVFITFLYRDERGSLRDGVIRFTTNPVTFDLKPDDYKVFHHLSDMHLSGLAHQIGPCFVRDGELYLSIGEAWKPFETQNIDQMYGKILRMSLDGTPLPDNPHFRDGKLDNPANYVWARGVRNPFGLTSVGDRIFAADNGGSIDRFMEIRKGENYLWNGQDASIATNADYVWVPSLGPVQMAYMPSERELFPEKYRQAFFLAMSGEPNQGKQAQVYFLPYDLSSNEFREVPRPILRYRGEAWNMLTGLAIGDEGLFVAPLFPSDNNKPRILKLTYDPENAHPHTLESGTDGFSLFTIKGCPGCHSINNFNVGGATGPALFVGEKMVEQITSKLSDPSYQKMMRNLDDSDKEVHQRYQSVREKILALSGLEQARMWIKYNLINPQFDKPYEPLMPNLGLTEIEAEKITGYLLGEERRSNKKQGVISKLLPPYGVKHMIAAFALGLLFMIFISAIYYFVLQRK